MNDSRLAIIVPYTEDRKEEMYSFVGHMDYFLKDKVNYDIHLINQKDADIFFNYGKLCNIGFDITSNDYDYFIFHDVNILPKQESCNYLNEYWPTHMCPNLKPYPHWIGGAFKITKENFVKVNGFSNDYWGGVFHWPDFHYRLNKHGLLPFKKFFSKEIYKKHQLNDVKEISTEIKKIAYPFKTSEDNCAFIKSNKELDYMFDDSFTISINVFINDNQFQDACIYGKEGYNMGLYIMRNEAIVFQMWDMDNQLHQIWYPHTNLKNKWTNITFRANKKYKESINIGDLFIDGKKVASMTLPIDLLDYTGKDLWIGNLLFKNAFRGKMSDFLIFDYALEDSEIERLYLEGYKTNDNINTTFEAVLDISFNKKFGDFFVDNSSNHMNARVISTGLHYDIEKEEYNLSYETNMPEYSNGRFEILENSKKFSNLDVYNWDEKDENFLENEKMYFEEIASGKLNTNKFGLNTLSYDLHSTTEIKKNVYMHTIKI